MALGQPIRGDSRRARAGDQGSSLRTNILPRGDLLRHSWLAGEERARRRLAATGMPTHAGRALEEWVFAGGRR